MSTLPEEILLHPADEARRLWIGALEARESADTDLVSLCASVDLGVRAAEVLVTHLLQPAKDRFPATVAMLLELPAADVEAHRDAVEVPLTLGFTAILDMLGHDDLDCVSPGLHHGWEDRRFACRRARGTAREAVGVTLEAPEREALLALSAYRNRIFRTPPPVRIVRAEVRAGFQALADLMERLRARPLPG